MEIDWDGRQVALSVRELAEFEAIPARGEQRRRHTRARLATGRIWHREMQAVAEAGAHPALFEQTLRGCLTEHGWTFDLHGRIDQVVSEPGRCVFREVKSTTTALPAPPDELSAAYPHYLRQLAIYVALGSRDRGYGDRKIEGELLFVDIGEGVTQVLPLDCGRFSEPAICHGLATYLEAGRALRSSHREATPRAPFERMREEQEPALAGLRQALGNANQQLNLLHAPTGFGKTGLVLQAALERLQEGRFERIIYASCKSSGQTTITRHLDTMLPQGNGPRYYRMQSRREHRLHCPLSHCGPRSACNEGLEEAWNRNERPLWDLLSGGSPGWDTVSAFSEQTRICPYEISRAILDMSEIWIGDYNYLFNPRSLHVFESCPTFVPERTLLILDEAHNLAERVAASWSFASGREEWVGLSGAAQFNALPGPLRESIDAVAAFLGRLATGGPLPATARYEWVDLLDAVVQRLEAGAPPLIEECWDPLWECDSMLNLIKHPDMDSLLWRTDPGVLQLSCLDPSREIAATLRQFRSVLAMSATLPPTEDLCRQWGLAPAEPALLTADAPWRDHAYDVGIDARADTRFRHRDRFYPLTARTILSLCEVSEQPIAVFFSSYRYAAAVEEYLQVMAPGFPSALQPRGLDSTTRDAFLDRSMLSARALLLVLGGIFSESIDRLGEHVDTVLIVGPALPEPSPVQEARMRRHAEPDRTAAFRDVFILPGITKINQALGRFVREPGHRARVILQDRRFARKEYRELLAPEYQSAAIIRTDEELNAWLARGSQHSQQNPLHRY